MNMRLRAERMARVQSNPQHILQMSDAVRPSFYAARAPLFCFRVSSLNVFKRETMSTERLLRLSSTRLACHSFSGLTTAPAAAAAGERDETLAQTCKRFWLK